MQCELGRNDMEGIEARAETTPARPSGTVSARYYRPELDWLRFLAFCLVFILHGFAFETADYVAMGVSSQVAEFVCVPLVLAGGYGVDLFFALSAFLITQLLLMERDRTGTVHIRSFYIRRVLRIWPLYFAFVLVAAAIEILWRNNSYQYYGSLVLFVCNWYAMFLQVPDTVTGHLWSISVEEQFYLVWPLLLAKAKPFRFVQILIGMFVFTCVYRIFCIYWAWPEQSPVWINTLAHLDSFALGGLLACLLHWRSITLARGWRALLLLVALAIYWRLGQYPIGGYFGVYPAWTYPLAAFASTLSIAAFCAGVPGARIGNLKRSLSYLGKISYGLYVFHLPVIHFAKVLIPIGPESSPWLWVARTALAATATLAVSAASYALLEKPFLRMKERFTYVKSRPE